MFLPLKTFLANVREFLITSYFILLDIKDTNSVSSHKRVLNLSFVIIRSSLMTWITHLTPTEREPQFCVNSRWKREKLKKGAIKNWVNCSFLEFHTIRNVAGGGWIQSDEREMVILLFNSVAPGKLLSADERFIGSAPHLYIDEIP